MPRDQVSRGIFISCTLGRAAGAENRECLLPRIREGAEVMDFRVLQYFVTVAEELNFSRAAEKLNMSQPPLSNQIRQLEQDLGTQLFIRGKRHLTLTESGRVLFRRSKEILEMADKTRGEIASLGAELSGSLAIGQVEGRAPFIDGNIIHGFGEEYPLVEYQLWNGSSDDVIDRIFRGLLDVGIIAAPYDEEHLDGIMVGQELWAAMIPKNHPLAKEDQKTVRLEQLAGERLLYRLRSSRHEAILRWFSDTGKEPNIVGTLSSFESSCAVAATNAGISIFPQTLSQPFPNIVTKIITNPVKRAEYYLVWNKSQPQRQLVREFIDYVKDYCTQLRAEGGMFRSSDATRIPEDADLL